MGQSTGLKRLSFLGRSVSVVLAAAIMGGCTRGSLLITPVSLRQGLVETELSRDSLFAFDKIALIDVSGVLVNAPRRRLLGGGENPVSLLLEQLEKARRDRRVKGVILRINSPGGSVVASELMHDEITRFRKSGKPVVAVMMDVAASGAYYIACACDEIVAHPSTVTGSIGVIMQMFDVSKTMDMLGVKSDAITTGTFKDAGSPLRAMRPDERELFQAIVNEMYERFVDVVVSGRPELDAATVRRLADGRIYTATQALEAGLIDRIANLHDTINTVKERIGAKGVRVVVYHRPSDYRPNYYASAPRPPIANISLLNIDLSTMVYGATPRFMYLWVPGR